MSNPDFDEIAATTLQEYAPTLEDQCFRNQPFMFWLTQAGRCKPFTGGRSIVCPLLVGDNSTCTTYAGYDTIPVTPQKGITAAEFYLKQAACSISLCGFEECVNQGAQEVIDLMDAKLMQAQETLTEHFNRMFILSNGKGNNGKDWNGLANLIGNRFRSPIAGNIDGSDPACEYWQSEIDDGGLGEAILNGDPKPPPRALTLKDMARMFNNVSNGTDQTDLILMSQDMFEAYECLLQPNQMFTNTQAADAGFQSLTYKGVAIMWDHFVPDDTIYFLNSKYIELRKKMDRWFSVTPFIQPVNQDARYAQIRMFGQLIIKNRKRQGVMCNYKTFA